MTDKQPHPLRIAEELDCHNARLDRQAAKAIRTQHADLLRKDALLRVALLLSDWLAETPHQRGSINGLAAQLQHAITKELQ